MEAGEALSGASESSDTLGLEAGEAWRESGASVPWRKQNQSRIGFEVRTERSCMSYSLKRVNRCTELAEARAMKRIVNRRVCAAVSDGPDMSQTMHRTFQPLPRLIRGLFSSYFDQRSSAFAEAVSVRSIL